MKNLLITFFLITVPQAVSASGIGAADDLLGDVGNRAGASDMSLGAAVGAGISIALSLVGLIFLILMVYAGFLWMTARGDEGQVDKARKTIISSTIGLVIVVSAYALTVFVGASLINKKYL